MTTQAMEQRNKPAIFLHKWSLLALISLVIILMAGVILALDPGVDGVRRVIRATARTSLLLFCMAFIASATWQRFPNSFTRWQRQNRRYLGLGFAVSHGIHAAAIVCFAVLAPESFGIASNTGSRISGGIAYLFIFLMSLTSFNRTAAWIGPRAWKILHTAGIYYIWISFMIAFGKRVPMSSLYVLPVALLLALLVFRLWPKKLMRDIHSYAN